MKKIVGSLFFLLVSVAIFAQSPKPAKKGVTYGAKTNAKDAISVVDLQTKLTTDSLYKGKVEGEVTSVCQTKGCWMTLKTVDGNDIMIKFKDYAFFMPKNISGKKVVLNGVAKVKTTSVEMLQHYAEDAGKSKDEIAAITAPKQEIIFMAAGVLVL
jgi:hypothetical protein